MVPEGDWKISHKNYVIIRVLNNQNDCVNDTYGMRKPKGISWSHFI